MVQQYLFQFNHLMREQLPKLGEHFTQEMINPSMYASQWFITVFSYSFPFHLALRIWDVFLFEVSTQKSNLLSGGMNFLPGSEVSDYNNVISFFRELKLFLRLVWLY